ncbi:hypothetical protein P7C73_g3578, partial [Tremellales sp. Uapishka_1]
MTEPMELDLSLEEVGHRLIHWSLCLTCLRAQLAARRHARWGTGGGENVIVNRNDYAFEKGFSGRGIDRRMNASRSTHVLSGDLDRPLAEIQPRPRGRAIDVPQKQSIRPYTTHSQYAPYKKNRDSYRPAGPSKSMSTDSRSSTGTGNSDTVVIFSFPPDVTTDGVWDAMQSTVGPVANVDLTRGVAVVKFKHADGLAAKKHFHGCVVDHINIPSCTARQFQVSNVPVAVDAATADTALFLLLSTLRQFKLALSSAQAGTFHSGLPLSNDPAGKVLGILGMGGIGRAFAKRATALGMTVVYHNRTRLGGEVERACGAKYVASMDELLRDSDVVSLNLPLNASTRHLISTDQFKAMKKTAVIINTARGPIIDEKALIAALASNQIAGAGLDVYETEPMIPKELLEDPRVTCLPHVGTLTVETQKEMEAVCLKNISRGLESGKLGFVVGEQKEMWSKLQ